MRSDPRTARASRSAPATAHARAGRAPHRARAGRDAGLHPAGDRRRRVRSLDVRGGRGARLRDGARQHLPPDALAGRGADRRRSAGCTGSWAGSGRSSPTPAASRSSRWPTAAVADEIKGRRGRAGRGGARCSRSARRGCASAPTRRLGAVPRPRGVDGGPGRARLRHRPRLRRVHAVPRRPRLHGALDRAHPPLARPLPRLARARGARRARRCSGSSRAASTRTCGESRPRRSPAAAVDGIAIGGTLGKDKEEMRGVLGMTRPHLPAEAPKHLLGIGEPDDLVEGIGPGIDIFDCAVPTRLARHGMALAPLPDGAVPLRRPPRALADDEGPLVEGCPCEACARHTPRLHPLPARERGADRRCACSTLHNLAYMERLVERGATSDRGRRVRRLRGGDPRRRRPWEAAMSARPGNDCRSWLPRRWGGRPADRRARGTPRLHRTGDRRWRELLVLATAPAPWSRSRPGRSEVLAARPTSTSPASTSLTGGSGRERAGGSGGRLGSLRARPTACQRRRWARLPRCRPR